MHRSLVELRALETRLTNLNELLEEVELQADDLALASFEDLPGVLAGLTDGLVEVNNGVLDALELVEVFIDGWECSLPPQLPFDEDVRKD